MSGNLVDNLVCLIIHWSWLLAELRWKNTDRVVNDTMRQMSTMLHHYAIELRSMLQYKIMLITIYCHIDRPSYTDPIASLSLLCTVQVRLIYLFVWLKTISDIEYSQYMLIY